nr:ATP-binding protein [Calditrichia bacterium]
TNQVERAANFESLPMENLGEEKRQEVQELLRRLTLGGSVIEEIFLIGTNNQVLFSSKPSLQESFEKRPYVQDKYLSKQKELLFYNRTDSTVAISVFKPVDYNTRRLGNLRLNVVISDLRAAKSTEFSMLLGCGIFLLVVGIIFFYLAFNSRKIHLPGVERAREEESPEKQEEGEESAPSLLPERLDKVDEEFGTLFMSLNKLYENTDDLDRTFSDSEKKIHYMMRVLNQGFLLLDLDMNLISFNEFLIDLLRFRTTSNARVKVEEVLRKNPQLTEIFQRAKDPMTHEVKRNSTVNLLNGSKIPVDVFAHPVYNGREMYGVVVYLKDTKVLKELEHSLQRSMKYGVISKLASSIGHEIRNPLSSLAIHTEIVDSMVERSISDPNRLTKIKKSISILNSEVERLNKLIDQFFKLAKTREATLSLEHINDLMNEVVDLIYQQALEKNINITKHFAPSLPMVKISKDQLKQVLINLVLNAYDAIGEREGGEVALQTEFREGKVLVSVKDNGSGIPVDVQKNIFDLYFTTKTSGGGIGLAISRKIVEAHEGRLYFETKPRLGTTFIMELPTLQN